MMDAAGLIKALASVVLAFRAGLGMYLGCWMIRAGVWQRANNGRRRMTMPWSVLALYVGVGIVLDLAGVLL